MKRCDHCTPWTAYAVTILALFAWRGVATAAVIDPSQADALDTLITQAPGNDGSDLLSNLAVVDLEFDRGQPAQVVLQASHTPPPDGPVTEYGFIVNLNNQTGTAWSGLQIDLVPPFSIPGLDLDTPPDGPPNTQVTFNSFPPDEHTDTMLVWTGLNVLSGNNPSAIFGLDLPNLATEDGYPFTLRFTPTLVPEPLTMWVIGLGLVCVTGRRR